MVALHPDGQLFDPANPGAAGRPARRPRDRPPSDPRALLAGSAVSGTYRRGVFAAVPYEAPSRSAATSQVVDLVVVLARSPPTGLAAGGPWFLFAALVIVAVVRWSWPTASGTASSAPWRRPRPVTGRIAAGDLAARVPEPPAADPELASLATSINSMAESLARARGCERDFLLSVSHELRTPLTSIRGFAEAIEDGAVTDDRAGRPR